MYEAAQSLLRHYLEYLSSPAPHIKALFTYPVKSCRGIELAASEVEPWGLKYDRSFTFAELRPQSTGDSAEGTDDREWRFITQREYPRLALIETELWVPDPRAVKTSKKTEKKNARNASRRSPLSQEISADDALDVDKKTDVASHGGYLIIRFPLKPSLIPFSFRPNAVSLNIPLVPSQEHGAEKNYHLEPISIWVDRIQSINITGEIPADTLSKLQEFLGVRNTLGLFRVDSLHRRDISRSLPKDRPGESYSVGFGDAFPLHLMSMASVYAQDANLPAKAAMKGRLDARRFRANIYVDGVPEYDEDDWKKIHVGRGIQPKTHAKVKGGAAKGKTISHGDQTYVETEGEYHVACRTARCKMPNVDQESGVKDTNEPLTTMRRTRQVDEGANPHPCLGMQMIPLFQQGILRVGDEVKVVERGEHYYEKML
ncbi:hypothetical protein BDY17DRAFT_315538 [Neohortaea acidophila]|uniref:MOSC domain-containing protein n=1 Tax=Neohortaea acidophila TaxID=245834 RepID=A0A6A6PXL5_9PEZI|nr:uncharacterized protein BDY17DRAFT_315538 [Neohortaea acidophila]KAF2484850.1 hypothetical protein BDY17DRAFT_315538 [Neohortaea acidophila]